jgi:hypothetical protein
MRGEYMMIHGKKKEREQGNQTKQKKRDITNASEY